MKRVSLVFLAVAVFGAVSAAMDGAQKHRCEQYTSIFENDTTDLQYAYCENIHDGRGFTAGRAGFTTGTSDGYEVVKKYTAHHANNPLAKFLPELEKLTHSGSGSVSHLSGYCNAWKEAAKDAAFRKVQDEVSDELYFK